jgi:trypsin
MRAAALGAQMNRVLALLLSALLLAAPAAAQAPSLPLRLSEEAGSRARLHDLAQSRPALAAALAALAARAEAEGSVRVAVRTAVPFGPEELLGDWERFTQRREIAAAARSLARALPQARDVSPLADQPYVLMTVDPSGLETLKTLRGIAGISAAESINWRRDWVDLRERAWLRHLGAKPSGSRVTPRIVGGRDADADTHPFQVGLLNKNNADNFEAQFCGGTLVAERFVVTAAHCSTGRPERDAQVLVGTRSLDGSGQRINVLRVHRHPSWSSRTDDYDVAVWELATPVTDIPFASLAATQPTEAGTPLRVTGWGQRIYAASNSYPVMLQQVDVPYVPTINRACNRQRGITARMICAGGTMLDSCGGDSGGPLTIARGEDGYTELVGIVSFGNGCGYEGYPGVYANVADSNVNRFIRNVVWPPPQVIQLQSATLAVNEGGRRLTVTVERLSGTGAASVRFATAEGTAHARSDFKSASGTLRFASGATTASFSVSLANDRTKEDPENFSISLSSPSAGWSLGTAAATVTITDND